MPPPLLRAFTDSDLPQALALNNAAVPAVNLLDEPSFRDLLSLATRSWVVDDAGTLAALFVTFAPGAPYASPNYRWHDQRSDDFLYVDRIVVAPTHRRLGLARHLYDTLADHARTNDIPRLVCEVNVEPPNPASIAFHEANGWIPLEDLRHGPGKVVRFFHRQLLSFPG